MVVGCLFMRRLPDPSIERNSRRFMLGLPHTGDRMGSSLRLGSDQSSWLTRAEVAVGSKSAPNRASALGHFRSLVIEPRPARGPAGDLQEPSRFNPPETCCRVWDGQSYEHGATPFPSRRACRDRRRNRTGRGHYTLHPSRTPIPCSVSTSICLCTLGWQVLAVEAHRNSRRGRID